MSIINTDYQNQIQSMHQSGKFDNGAKQFHIVKPFLEQYRPTSLLDFGCGKGSLIRCIQEFDSSIACRGYDPGNPEFATMPEHAFDAVISTDAIEHIEPEFLDETLAMLFSKMKRACFLRIACHPAKKHLPDGRNCHLIVESPQWWRARIAGITSAEIVWENIEKFDKTAKWPELKGH